jgi:hypothetical protein
MAFGVWAFIVGSLGVLLFAFERTKVVRPDQPLLYFFRHNDIAPGYGAATGVAAVGEASRLTYSWREVKDCLGG